MRKTFALAVFYVYLSAAAVLVEVVGLTAAWGVESPTNVTSAVGETRAAFSSIDPSGGLGDTLFGTFTAIGGIIETMGSLLFALPILFTNMGIPAPFTAFLFSPLFLIVGRGIFHALTGRFS